MELSIIQEGDQLISDMNEFRKYLSNYHLFVFNSILGLFASAILGFDPMSALKLGIAERSVDYGIEIFGEFFRNGFSSEMTYELLSELQGIAHGLTVFSSLYFTGPPTIWDVIMKWGLIILYALFHLLMSYLVMY